MNSAERAQFVEQVIGEWIDAGLTLPEMEKTAEFMAATIESCEQQKVAVSTVVDDLQKHGNAGLFVTDALKNIGGSLFNTASSTASKLLTQGAQKAMDLSPLLAGGGLAGVGLAGYTGGQLYGALSEDPKETEREIKNQELIDTLREHAAIARTRNTERQSLRR